MGPGRTGVKGVIRDEAEVKARASQKQASKAEYDEEKWEEMMLEGLDKLNLSKASNGTGGARRFGHLREVGMRGYVDAVEKEERGIWVVVHIYDPVSDYYLCSRFNEASAFL